MSKGLEMMMKSFGFNPKEIMGQVQEFANLVVQFNTKLDMILLQQKAIMQRLEIDPAAALMLNKPDQNNAGELHGGRENNGRDFAAG